MDANKNQAWRIVIDGVTHVVEDPVLTGRQILSLADKQPPEEHMVLFLDQTRRLEHISLDESVDLRERGVEEFFTFLGDRLFRFELDGRDQVWGADAISETMLRKLAGVGDDYRVWLERRKEEDKQLEKGERVPLTDKGVERFYTGRDDTTAGAAEIEEDIAVLPLADRRYLVEHGIAFEEVAQDSAKGIIFKDYLLPPGRFLVERADILVVLPAGYADVAPDMFHCDPWLKLRATGEYPHKANKTFELVGRKWQRWSRHNQTWRVGVDGVHTILRRIDRALREGQ